MASIKPFLRKYEVFIVILGTLFFIYAIAFFDQKINFLLGNELIVNLNPTQKSFSMHYGDKNNISFSVSIENAAYCRAVCSYEFIDRSRSLIIDKNNFEIGIGDKFQKIYNLTVKRLGSGQDLYAFEVRCKSIKSIFCYTKGSEKSRNALITVNYDLTEAEKKLKSSLMQNVSRFLALLSDVDIEHQKISQKYFELGKKANLNNITPLKIELDDTFDRLSVDAENLRSLWATEDYNRLNKLFNKSYFESAIQLNKSIIQLNQRIDIIVKTHNGFIAQVNELHEEADKLNKFALALDSEEILYDVFVNNRHIEKIASDILNNTFENYDEVNESVSNISKQQINITSKSINPSSNLFFKLEYSLKKDRDLLCELNGECNASIQDIISKTEQFVKNYPNIDYFKQSCNSIDELEMEYENEGENALLYIESKNKTFVENETFLNSSRKFLQNVLRRLNNSYLESYESLSKENKTEKNILAMAFAILPKEKVNLTELEYDKPINLSLYFLSKINVSKDIVELKSKCGLMSKSLKPIGLVPVNALVNYTISQRINTNLSDNPPVCCVFNECRPCCNDESCRNDPKTYPIVFIHGHSFAKDNSPEFSLDSFNKMQDKLQEDGYLSAGIISLYSANEPVEPGIWSLSGRPITVKVSYYYDAFRKEDKYIVVPTKSENIDTYALRLKDLIEMVKQRTSKPKVNIIAHSMGGLVARRYIQIFGEDEVDKLIMIATPNHGITGSAANYCGIVGENRECQDMFKDSLFLNKLNDPLKQPAVARLYNVIGTGCAMDNGDGDGVVYAEDAKLDNSKSYFVKGTCSGYFGEKLHTSMLNVEKYPETYRIVADILKE